MRRSLACQLACSLAVIVGVAACSSPVSPDAGNGLPAGRGSVSAVVGQIPVVAGENFWGDIVRQIGGGRVAVRSIISDPNADPHEYEASASDAAAVAQARLVVGNGLGYDSFLDKMVTANPATGRVVLHVADVVGARRSNTNPHLWYNPRYVAAAGHAIERQLAAADPAGAPGFAANLQHFLNGEQQVVAVINQIKAKHAGVAIAYTERVPGYLVAAAGLLLGTPASFAQALEDGTDPSPRDTADFDAALTGHRVKVLLYNAQATSPTTQKIRDLAARSGIPVVAVTETLPPGARDFQTWQADQARALLSALGG